MRRRLTILLVLVSVLMYGTAWAFDGHWPGDEDHAHAVAHTDPGHPAGDDGCDHCCHAGAHLLGFPSRGFAAPRLAPQTFRPGAPSLTRSRAWDPPFKPPRS